MHQGLLHTRGRYTAPPHALGERHSRNNGVEAPIRQGQEDQVRDETWPGIPLFRHDAGEGGGVARRDAGVALRRHGARPVPVPGDAAVVVPVRAGPGARRRGERGHGVQAGRPRAGLPRRLRRHVRLEDRPDAGVAAAGAGDVVALRVPGERAGRQDLPRLRPLAVARLRLRVPGPGGGVHAVLGARGGPEGAQEAQRRPPAVEGGRACRRAPPPCRPGGHGRRRRAHHRRRLVTLRRRSVHNYCNVHACVVDFDIVVVIDDLADRSLGSLLSFANASVHLLVYLGRKETAQYMCVKNGVLEEATRLYRLSLYLTCVSCVAIVQLIDVDGVVDVIRQILQ